MTATSCFFRVIAFITTAAVCTGQRCNPNLFRPSMLPPCNTIGSQIGAAVEATVAVKARIAEFNEQLYQARKRFWAVYPDGPGYAAAELEFLTLLREKNFTLLSLYLVSGMTGSTVNMINTLDFGPGVTVEEYRRRLRGDINLFDGGLNPTARPLFVQWVNALRREGGAKKDGDLLVNPIPLAQAITQPSLRRQAYERAQLWAEILASGVDLKKYFTPEVYVQLMMETRVSVALGAAETPDIPNCQAATVALYQTLARVMGEKEVADAAAAVFAAPKSAWGDLATSTDVDIGNHQTATYEPFLRFLDLLAHSRPRNYAIALLLDQYQLNTAYMTKEKWLAAAAEYDQRVKKFGEPTVLAAATKVMTARKSANGGIRGDPQYRPTNAWFDLALQDPNLVVPDGNLPHFKASSYTTRWLGKHLAVRGTVSRVNVDKGGRPEYATILFKETRRNEIVAFTPYSRELQGVYGNDFTGLVGATVEIYGEVQEWREVAGVRVLDVRQIAVVKGGFGPDDGDSSSEWLTAPEPTLVENPLYATWKKFTPGTTLTMVERVFTEAEPGTDQYQRNDLGRSILRLESIDAEKVVILARSSTNKNGGPFSAPDQTVVYKAMVLSESVPLRPAPNESGDETLEISGRKYATHWEKVLNPVGGKSDPNSFTKTWYSDDVPGRQVLVRQQGYNETLKFMGKIFRTYSITMIEPVIGIEPELGPLKPDAKKSVLLVSTVSIDEIRARYKTLGERQTATIDRLAVWLQAHKAVAPPPAVSDFYPRLVYEMRKVFPQIMVVNRAGAEAAMIVAEAKMDEIDRFLKTGELPGEPKPTAPATTPGTNKGASQASTPSVRTPTNSSSGGIATPADMIVFDPQYRAMMMRGVQAKSGLVRLQFSPATKNIPLPPDVSNARDRLDGELAAVNRAMASRKKPQIEQGLRTAEATVIVIEQYLNRLPSP